MLLVGGAIRFGLFADQSRPAPGVRALTKDGRKIGGPEKKVNKNFPTPLIKRCLSYQMSNHA